MAASPVPAKKRQARPERRPGRQPTRTCVACRSAGSKRDLVRLVRGSDGTLAVDESGRAPGRGAYLGPQRACWQQALRTNQLGNALRMTVSPSDRQLLDRHANRLPGDPCPHLERDQT